MKEKRSLSLEWLSRLEPKRAPNPSPERTEAAQILVECAAVRGTFEVEELVADAGLSKREGVNDAIARLLAQSVTVEGPEGGSPWELKDHARRQALRRLVATDRLQSTLDDVRSGDEITRLLRLLIANPGAPRSGASLEKLAAMHRVAKWLDGIVEGVPSPDEIRALLERRTLLQPLIKMTRGFLGREKELRQLREYVGALPAKSWTERITRTLAKVVDLEKSPPLFIHGPGGVGKSTLVAKFVLDHVDMEESRGLAFAYLNFDRIYLRVEEPLTLLLDAVHQVGVLEPQHGERARELHRQWRREIRDRSFDYETDSKSSRSVRLSSVSREEYGHFARQFGEFLDHVLEDKPSQPFLLVLDTFEEVQSCGSEYERYARNLLSVLQRECPALRVVLAGRAPATSFRTTRIELSSLDPAVAVEFVRRNVVADQVSPELARTIVDRVGTSPVSLRLAVDAVQAIGVEALDDLAVGWRFWKRLEDSQVQGVLFKRILQRIRDPELRKLAHPGLALRRITPEIILEVLAKPCGLLVKDLHQAKELFDKLGREVSLVEVHDDALKYRADVRRLVLRALEEEDSANFDRIHRAAVKYYADRTGTADRTEELYHRLSLDQSSRTLDGRWIDEAGSLLQSALDELAPRPRAYLAARLDLEIGEEDRQAAELETWERYVARKSRNLIQHDDAEAAIQLLEERSERSADSPLFELHAQALERLGRVEEALFVTTEGLRSATRTADLPAILAHFRRRGRLQKEAGLVIEARESLEHAAQVAAKLDDDLMRLKVALETLELLDADGDEARMSGLRDLAQGWAEAVHPGTLLRHRQTLRDAMSWLGSRSPKLTRLALRELSPDSLDPDEREGLAQRLAEWSRETAEQSEGRSTIARYANLDGDHEDEGPWLKWIQDSAQESVVNSLSKGLKRYGSSGDAARAVQEFIVRRLVSDEEEPNRWK